MLTSVITTSTCVACPRFAPYPRRARYQYTADAAAPAGIDDASATPASVVPRSGRTRVAMPTRASRRLTMSP